MASWIPPLQMGRPAGVLPLDPAEALKGGRPPSKLQLCVHACSQAERWSMWLHSGLCCDMQQICARWRRLCMPAAVPYIWVLFSLHHLAQMIAPQLQPIPLHSQG